MATLNKEFFSGSNGFTDAHNELQAATGNVAEYIEFSPFRECYETQVLNTLALKCAIACEFPIYIACKLVSHTDSITIKIACHPRKWSSDISILLKIQRTPSFSLESFGVLFIPECSITCKMLHYIIKYGEELRALRIVCIESVKPAPRVLMWI